MLPVGLHAYYHIIFSFADRVRLYVDAFPGYDYILCLLSACYIPQKGETALHCSSSPIGCCFLAFAPVIIISPGFYTCYDISYALHMLPNYGYTYLLSCIHSRSTFSWGTQRKCDLGSVLYFFIKKATV